MTESTRALRESIYADAVAFIEAADHHPTVEEVARAVATSRRQLQRVFRDVGETTFRQHVLAARLDHARVLLADGMPVGEVARRTGYSHASHFSRAFRRHHGQSPSAFVPA